MGALGDNSLNTGIAGIPVCRINTWPRDRDLFRIGNPCPWTLQIAEQLNYWGDALDAKVAGLGANMEEIQKQLVRWDVSRGYAADVCVSVMW